ncbi:MAG TPA: hypothetical protein VFZ76_19480 [Anaerolineales bacterium]
MLTMDFTISTFKENPQLKGEFERLYREAWPEFLLHMDVKHWDRLFTTFAEFQVLVCDPGDELMAFSNSLPISWNGKPDDLPESIGAIFDRALETDDKSEDANTLVAFTANIGERHQREGLSSKLLRAVKALAANYGYGALIVPVRPILKGRYPLIPMQRYAHWRREDGAPFDPWIRVHWRLGGEILKVEPNARPVSGTIWEWEEWTGMRFPESGEYIVPNALIPVMINREADTGLYQEPAVWVKHTI